MNLCFLLLLFSTWGAVTNAMHLDSAHQNHPWLLKDQKPSSTQVTQMLCVIEDGVYNVQFSINGITLLTNGSGPIQHTLEKDVSRRCHIYQSKHLAREWRLICPYFKQGTYQCFDEHKRDTVASNVIDNDPESNIPGISWLQPKGQNYWFRVKSFFNPLKEL